MTSPPGSNNILAIGSDPVYGDGTCDAPTDYTLPTGTTVTGSYQWSVYYTGDANNEPAEGHAPSYNPNIISGGVYSNNAAVQGLIVDSQGNAFGISNHGGRNNNGFLFEVPAGTTNIRTLVDFGSGIGPPAFGLSEDSNGDFFGATSESEFTGDGSVFEYSTSTHTFKTVAEFTVDGGSGADPEVGPIVDSHLGVE